jgi:hypothetical protein
MVTSPRPAWLQRSTAVMKPSGARGETSMHTPAFPKVSAGHFSRRSCAVAPPTRSALAALGTVASADSLITPEPKLSRRRSRARSVRSRMSRLRIVSFRMSLLRMLLSTTSSLPTWRTAYEVPPRARNKASVATTFAYERRSRRRAVTSRHGLKSIPQRRWPPSRADHHHSRHSGAAGNERISALRGQPGAEAVRHAAEGSAEAVRESP